VTDIVVTQAGYYGIPRSVALKRAEVVLKALDLWEKRNGTARSLSGGMKRRLMIARALMHEPKLLILDEPTAGVDVELRYGMWEYLNELNRQGTTILLTTHYLEEVEQLCRNVAIIKEGEIVKQGAVKTLMHSLESQHYILTVDDLAKNFELKKYISTQVDDNTLEVEMKQGSDFQDLFSALAEQGVKVRDIRPKGNRMESLFLNILNTP
jgi:ABC-2 type transport system ATP-binding protein